MPILPYETPEPRKSSSPAEMLLVGLPLVAGAAVLVSLGWCAAEPFGTFSGRDLAVFTTTPLVVLASAIVWVAAARRRRKGCGDIVMGLLWFGLTLLAAVGLLLLYFGQPWNT